MSLKKLITPAVLTAIGFGLFNEHVREAFVNQPNWLMIIEASIAYVVIGFLTGVDVALKFAMNDRRSYIKVDPDGFFGTLSGILWPAYWIAAKPIAMISRVAFTVAKKRLTNLLNKRDHA